MREILATDEQHVSGTLRIDVERAIRELSEGRVVMGLLARN